MGILKNTDFWYSLYKGLQPEEQLRFVKKTLNSRIPESFFSEIGFFSY